MSRIMKLGTIATALFAFCMIARLAMSDPPEATEWKPGMNQTLQEKAAAFEEIRQIRNKLGGSVLDGSLLESKTDSGPLFEAGVRAELGLPQPKMKPVTLPRQTHAQIVGTLRKRAADLDRIANELELVREYKHGDALRDTAEQLRLIARQFDKPAAGSEK